MALPTPNPQPIDAQVTKEGVTVSEPFALDTKWDYALFRDPSANAVGTW